MFDHPSFRNRADMLPHNHALLIDDERLRHSIDAEVDADPSCSVHPVGEGLAELPDELTGGAFLILDVDADDDHALVPKPLPDTLQPGGFLVAGRIAPGSPEVDNQDLASKGSRVQNAAREERQLENGRRPADKRGGERSGVPGESEGEQPRHRERHQQGDGNRSPRRARLGRRWSLRKDLRFDAHGPPLCLGFLHQR